ncbi:MAG TPA: hypothetical protein VEK76_01785 [Candidatus Binatia bacterium]|nr:hypothetical protein [Candidatus Binatia bacterium]
MTTLRADEVRIPRRAREAVARHDAVVVLTRERPTFVIVHPDDHPTGPTPRGRSLAEALRVLARAPLPDPAFGDDLEAVIAAVGDAPADPWAPS